MVMFTDPVADGASVTYSVSNTTVGSLSPTSGTTNSTGENRTTLTVTENGTVTTYVTSGADGDRVTFIVNGIPSGPQPGVVYTTTNGYLRSIDANGRVFEFGPSGQVTAQAVGPMDADIDGDGYLEVPYVDGSGDLKIRDMNGEVQTLVPAGSGVTPGTSGRIGVGSYRTGDPEVYFVNDNSRLYRADWEGGASTGAEGIYRNPSNQNNLIQAQSVAGVGDFLNDGDNEIVHVDSGNKLAYLNERTNNGQNRQETAVNNDNVVGIAATSEPGQLDGDPPVDVVWRTGNAPNVRVADGNGQDDTLPALMGDDNPKSGASMALFDYTGDSTPELIYVDQNQELKYYNFVTGSTGWVLDENGGNVTVGVGPGVA
jgi:hypothetical protein